METSERKRPGEIKINIIDMIFTIVMHWRSVCISMLILAILFGGFSYYKSAKYVENRKLELQKDNAGNDYESELAAMNLTDDKIETAEHAAIILYGYQLAYNEQEKYMNESVYMNLNATSVPTVVLKYYIDNHYKTEYPVITAKDNVGAIKEAFQGKLKSDELYAAMAAALQSEDKQNYMSELVVTDVDLFTTDTVNNSNVLTIILYGPSEENVMNFAKCVKELLQYSVPEVKSVFGEFDLVLMGEEYTQSSNTELINNQKKASTTLHEILNNISDLEAKLDEDVYEYAKVCMKSMLEVEEKNTKIEESKKVTEKQEELKPYISKKYVLLGAIFGVFLVVGWNIFVYLINGRLRNEDELEDNFGLHILGVIEDDQDKKKVFGFVDQFILKLWKGKRRQFTTEETLDMIAAGICISASKFESKKVFITGCNISDREKDYINKIKKKLEKDGLEVAYGNNMIYNPESLLAMSKSEGVVLMETAKNSTYQEIAKEMELLLAQGNKIIGAVVMK